MWPVEHRIHGDGMPRLGACACACYARQNAVNARHDHGESCDDLRGATDRQRHTNAIYWLWRRYYAAGRSNGMLGRLCHARFRGRLQIHLIDGAEGEGRWLWSAAHRGAMEASEVIEPVGLIAAKPCSGRCPLDPGTPLPAPQQRIPDDDRIHSGRGDRCRAEEGAPRLRPHHAVDRESIRPLEGPHRGISIRPEDTITNTYLRVAERLEPLLHLPNIVPLHARLAQEQEARQPRLGTWRHNDAGIRRGGATTRPTANSPMTNAAQRKRVGMV